MCSQIKRTAIEVILYLRVGRPDILVAHLLWQWDGLAVIEVSAVGRPGGVHFQEVRILGNDAHRVGLHIVEDHVAGQVGDLNLVGMYRMECLPCLVGGEGNQLSGRMP